MATKTTHTSEALGSITDDLEAPHFQFRTSPAHEQLFLEFCKEPLIGFQRVVDPAWRGHSTFRFDCTLSRFRELLDRYLEAGYPFGFGNFDPDAPRQPAIEFEDGYEEYDFG